MVEHETGAGARTVAAYGAAATLEGPHQVPAGLLLERAASGLLERPLLAPPHLDPIEPEFLDLALEVGIGRNLPSPARGLRVDHRSFLSLGVLLESAWPASQISGAPRIC